MAPQVKPPCRAAAIRSTRRQASDGRELKARELATQTLLDR